MEINDLSVGVLNSMYSFGNLIAPIAGGILSYFYGYDKTCDIIAFTCVGFSVFFYFTMIFGRKLS